MHLIPEVLTSDVVISSSMPGKADLSCFTCGKNDHIQKEIQLQKFTCCSNKATLLSSTMCWRCLLHDSSAWWQSQPLIPHYTSSIIRIMNCTANMQRTKAAATSSPRILSLAAASIRTPCSAPPSRSLKRFPSVHFDMLLFSTYRWWENLGTISKQIYGIIQEFFQSIGFVLHFWPQETFWFSPKN